MLYNHLSEMPIREQEKVIFTEEVVYLLDTKHDMCKKKKTVSKAKPAEPLTMTQYPRL